MKTALIKLLTHVFTSPWTMYYLNLVIYLPLALINHYLAYGVLAVGLVWTIYAIIRTVRYSQEAYDQMLTAGITLSPFYSMGKTVLMAPGLDREELWVKWGLAHEEGHLKYHHSIIKPVFTILLQLLAPIMVIELPIWQACIGLSLIGLLYQRIHYQLEYAADAYACRLLGAEAMPEAFTQIFTWIDSQANRINKTVSYDGRGWQYPTVEQRLARQGQSVPAGLNPNAR